MGRVPKASQLEASFIDPIIKQAFSINKLLLEDQLSLEDLVSLVEKVLNRHYVLILRFELSTVLSKNLCPRVQELERTHYLSAMSS